jgi:two-component system NarL family sensor kinase
LWAFSGYLLLLLGIIFGYIRFRINKNQEKIIQIKKHSQDIVDLQDKERTRVARELHDSVIQLIISSKLKINSLESRIQEGLLEETKSIKDLLDTASTEIRRISHNLHPIILDDLGLVGGINSLCREFRQRAKININLECGDFPQHLPSEYKINIYRIIQEALNNIEKHSQASEADKFFIRINIRDNGKGFKESISVSKEDKEVSFGLRNMRDRVNFLDGDIKIQSEPGHGVEINIEIPFS